MRYIGIIILLVLCLTLLLLTGCIVNTVVAATAIGNLENQDDINQSSNNFQSATTGSVQEPTEEPETENPQKWSGLGMNIFPSEDSYIDLVLANGFTEVRHLTYYDNADWLADSKAKVISWVAKGAKVIWGVTAPAPITSTNWDDYRAAILSAAQWAEDNGVYEFQLGNEEENHVDGTTITATQLITNLKSVATEIQAIFTNGKISYPCYDIYIPNWISGGKGDIDLLATNIYRGGGGWYGDDWKTIITNLVNAFGFDGTYLTEFNLSWSSIDDYSTDEAVQAEAITEMIEYIKASGMTRALYFTWIDDGDTLFGVVKNDGTYRLLWSQALLNSGSVKFATVPTKTTTVSLLGTIALLPK